jgi:hypothetical protein
VQAATGPLDDDTLGRLICAVRGWEFGSTAICCGDDGSDEFSLRSPSGSWLYNEYRQRCPDISIDAALALVERCGMVASDILHEAWSSVGKSHALYMRIWKPEVDGNYVSAVALAILSALLAAIEAKEKP